MSELDLNIIEVIPCAGSNNDDGDSAIVPRIMLEDDNREKNDIEGTQDIQTIPRYKTYRCKTKFV